MKEIEIRLKDGTIAKGDFFEDEDFVKLKNIYKLWKNINNNLEELKGRKINIPELLSEGLYAYFFNAIRTNNSAGSYDCVDLETLDGIQVKATSIESDLTSFGPTSTWDKLIFMDFAPKGFIDNEIYIYHIDYNVKDVILNSKGETFEYQQKQGRRPRFSIKKEFINKYDLKPIKIIKL